MLDHTAPLVEVAAIWDWPGSMGAAMAMRHATWPYKRSASRRRRTDVAGSEMAYRGAGCSGHD